MTQRPVVAVLAEKIQDVQALSKAILDKGGDTKHLSPMDIASPEEALAASNGLMVGYNSVVDSDSPLRNLIRMAIQMNLPTLGTGEGMHYINLVLGGNWPIQVERHFVEGEMAHRHHVYVAPGSRLAKAVGAGGIVQVNSIHKTGIKEPQKSTQVLASAYCLDDGVIEAIESTQHDWVIAVQFRPELVKQLPPHFGRLFQELVSKARARLPV